MRRRPPRSTRTDTLFPYTTVFRSVLLRLQPGSHADSALGAGAESQAGRLAQSPPYHGGTFGQGDRAGDQRLQHLRLTQILGNRQTRFGRRYKVEHLRAEPAIGVPRSLWWLRWHRLLPRLGYRSEERAVGKEVVSKGRI